MKNLFKFSAILITASVLFSSCESNLSITKRRYTSGYYVDYTKTNKTISPTKVTQPMASIPQTISKQSSSMTNAVQPENKRTIAIVPAIKKILPKINLLPITKQSELANTEITEAPSLQNSKAVSGSQSINDKVSATERGERDALSLLWLVIVIILVLWLVALIAGGFGLGGLINLLLVIALILLVLWLLRII